MAIFGSIGLTKVSSTLATTLRSVIMATMQIVITLLTGQLQIVWRGWLGLFLLVGGVYLIAAD